MTNVFVGLTCGYGADDMRPQLLGRLQQPRAHPPDAHAYHDAAAEQGFTPGPSDAASASEVIGRMWSDDDDAEPAWTAAALRQDAVLQCHHLRAPTKHAHLCMLSCTLLKGGSSACWFQSTLR